MWTSWSCTSPQRQGPPPEGAGDSAAGREDALSLAWEWRSFCHAAQTPAVPPNGPEVPGGSVLTAPIRCTPSPHSRARARTIREGLGAERYPPFLVWYVYKSHQR